MSVRRLADITERMIGLLRHAINRENLQPVVSGICDPETSASVERDTARLSKLSREHSLPTDFADLSAESIEEYNTMVSRVGDYDVAEARNGNSAGSSENATSPRAEISAEHIEKDYSVVLGIRDDNRAVGANRESGWISQFGDAYSVGWTIRRFRKRRTTAQPIGIAISVPEHALITLDDIGRKAEIARFGTNSLAFDNAKPIQPTVEMDDPSVLCIGNPHVETGRSADSRGCVELMCAPPESADLGEKLTGWRKHLDAVVTGIAHEHLPERIRGDI